MNSFNNLSFNLEEIKYMFFESCLNSDSFALKKIISIEPKVVSFENEEKEIGLHFACKKGNLKIVKILLENGSNINHQDEIGQTPLYFATYFEFIDIVEELLEKGANPNLSVFSSNWNPLFISVFFDFKDISELLIEFGCDVNSKDLDNKNSSSLVL